MESRSSTSQQTATKADVATQLSSSMSEHDGLALSRTMLEESPLRGSLCGEAFVVRSEVGRDRAGQPYLILGLRDVSGATMPARWWRYPYPVDRRPAAGTICWFRATVDAFGGERQLTILEGRHVATADLNVYVRATRTPLSTLQQQLEQEIAGLDTDLQALVRTVLADEVYTRYCEWPAAQYHHGAVRHGLLAHSLRVAQIGRHLAQIYVPPEVPCDVPLVAATALLHDVGKTQTLPALAGGPLPDDARQIDHVTLGVLLVRLAAARCRPTLASERLEALTHALLAHHGQREWGAPVEPATLEAWLVHLADLVDARLWHWSGEEQVSEMARSGSRR